MKLKRLFLPLLLAFSFLFCRASIAEDYVSPALIALLPEAWQTAQVVCVASNPQEAEVNGPVPFTQALQEEWHVSKVRHEAIILKSEDRLALAAYVKADGQWRLTAFNERFGHGDCPIPQMSFSGTPIDALSIRYPYRDKNVSLYFDLFTTADSPLGFWRYSSGTIRPQKSLSVPTRETWQICYVPLGSRDDEQSHFVALYCDSREPETGDVMSYIIVLEYMENRSLGAFSLNEFALYLDKLDRVTIRPPEP